MYSLQQLAEAIRKDAEGLAIKKASSKKKRSDRERRVSTTKSVSADTEDVKESTGGKFVLAPLGLATMSVTSVGTDGDSLSTRRTTVSAQLCSLARANERLTCLGTRIFRCHRWLHKAQSPLLVNVCELCWRWWLHELPVEIALLESTTLLMGTRVQLVFVAAVRG